MKKYASFLLFIFAVTRCGSSALHGLEALETPSEESIEETSDYPGVVRVIGPGGYGLCTGAFVSRRAVLTAAHCTLREGTYTVMSSNGMLRTEDVHNFGPGSVEDPNDLSVLVFDEDVVPESDITRLGLRATPLERVRLVGYGCNDLERRSGSGRKRTGTNQIYRVSNYLELVTPRNTGTMRNLLGPINRAGSCFGDSGGPMFRELNETLELVGVAHAGSWNTDHVISYYVDLNRWDNLDFLSDIDRLFGTGILDQCTQAATGYDCSGQSADMGIFGFLKWIWGKILSFFHF